MRWIVRIVLGLVAVVAMAAGAMFWSLWTNPLRPTRAVGIDQVVAADPGHAPVGVLVYYPAVGKPRLTWMGLWFVDVAAAAPIEPGNHPLILISHGTAGSATSHIDTALALAEKGFIVAAPIHTGDNFQDQTNIGKPSWIVDRARQLKRVNDFMLERWRGHASIDQGRIGVFGFSAGATTALISIGAQPDFGKILTTCKTHPEFVCQLLSPGARLSNTSDGGDDRDVRIKAAVLASPGLGMAFDATALARITVPVQVWVGALDVNAPAATNADAIAAQLPTPPSLRKVPNAGHFAFLAPCGALGMLLPPMLCTDPPGFDRKAFHYTFNAQVVDTFQRGLR
jgi:predicted dienelactone hydrolase